MITERKLLDLSLYNDPQGFNQKGLTADVAAAALEVDTTKPPSERTHRVLLAVVNGKNVINWPVNKQRDVKDQYSEKTEFDRREKEAGIAIREFLINGKVGECFAWISPPGGEYNYDEARLEIGVIRQKMGFKILESYGIPLSLTPKECINIYSYLDEFSAEVSNVKEVEDLRSNIVRFTPPGVIHWLNFLSEEFPALNEVWISIKNGSVSERNRKAKAEAREKIAKVMPKLLRAKTEYDFVYQGALIEQYMISRGYQVQSSACGRSNMELLRQMKGFPYSLSVGFNPISGFAEVNLVNTAKEKWSYHTGRCRLCEKDEVEVGPCKICKTCEKQFDRASFDA